MYLIVNYITTILNLQLYAFPKCKVNNVINKGIFLQTLALRPTISLNSNDYHTYMPNSLLSCKLLLSKYSCKIFIST